MFRALMNIGFSWRYYTRSSITLFFFQRKTNKPLNQHLVYTGAQPLGGQGAWHPSPLPHTHTHLNFQTKQGPTVSVSNIRDIAFFIVQKWYGPKISGFLPCVLQYLDNLRRLHLGSSEKDLLKSFLLWTIQKKTTVNERLNVRL